MTQIHWISVNCNLCGADNARLRVQDRAWREGHKYTFDIVQCRRCGLIYTNPTARSEVFDNLAGGGARGNAAIANRPIYAAGVTAIRSHLSTVAAEPAQVRLLDIGCAFGDFLAYANNLGWDVSGADISPHLVAEARKRGFTVHEGDLAEIGLSPESYDVVTMWDVIEHLNDPQGFLKTIRPLLKPNGLLFFHTGNARFQIFKARILSRLLPNRGPFLIPYQHLYHFDPTSARAMLVATGFEPIAVFSCGTLNYPNRWKRLALGVYNGVAGTIAHLGGPLWTSAMGVLARRPRYARTDVASRGQDAHRT